MTRRDKAPPVDDRYGTAFLDWLACCTAGRPFASFAQLSEAHNGGLPALVVSLGSAGHVLDYDDTYTPGLCHISAATAPVALVLGSALRSTVAEMLHAYARGFQAMARMSAQSHPALYDAGWHPTAVCGSVGAAVTTATLLRLDQDGTQQAVRVALLSASGMLAAFGSHGKSVQVGLAAANGLLAGQLAAAGVQVAEGVESQTGFPGVYGGGVKDLLDPEPTAIGVNWLKAYPCCLQTHAPIDAALNARDAGVSPAGHGSATVHPVSRQAAAYDDVTTGLEAKFSIPYTTAWGLLRGRPNVRDFDEVDPEVRALAERIEVRTDRSLAPNECILTWSADGEERSFRVDTPLGCPANPMTPKEHQAKIRDLAGDRLDGILDDEGAAVSEVLRAVGW